MYFWLELNSHNFADMVRNFNDCWVITLFYLMLILLIVESSQELEQQNTKMKKNRWDFVFLTVKLSKSKFHEQPVSKA